MTIKNYKLSGLSKNIELGKNGIHLDSEDGFVSIKDNQDNFVDIKVGSGNDPDSAATVSQTQDLIFDDDSHPIVLDINGNRKTKTAIFHAVIETNSSGEFTLDLTPANFNEVLSFDVTPVREITGVNSAIFPSIDTANTSTISGRILKSNSTRVILSNIVEGLEFAEEVVTLWVEVKGVLPDSDPLPEEE